MVPTRSGSALAIAALAFAFLVVMMATTMPTPLYPVYSARYGFTPLTITVLFSVYAAGVVASLLLFGRVSDRIGRRPVMLTALALTALSNVCFLVAGGLPLLLLGRVLSGLAAGLISGTGTAALLDRFPPEHRATGAALAVGVNMGGLAIGNLFSGVVADLSHGSLHATFAVHLVLTLLAIGGLLLFVERPIAAGDWSWQFQKPAVPPAIRRAYFQAVLAGGAGWAVTSVLTATSGLFLATVLHLPAHTLAGGVLFVTFSTMAIGQLLARRWPPTRALMIGCAGQVIGTGLLAASLAGEWLAPLFLAAFAIGVASGICLNAGVALTAERVPSDQRGEVSSALFAGLYVMLSFPAIGVGLLATRLGLQSAGLIFCAVVAVLAAAVGFSLLDRGDRRHAVTVNE